MDRHSSIGGLIMEIATLGGGCFWCLEAALRQLAGVESVVSGYCGGHVEQPTYRQICAGDTGHAEVVRVTFDPAAIDYRTLLEAFFAIHDPTTRDRQGNDIGSQYRSVVFTHSAAQEATARRADRGIHRAESVAEPDRHRSPARTRLLAGRGLPPGLSRPQPAAALLHGGGGTEGGQAAREVP